MAFSAATTDDQLVGATSAMVLLRSSCQAIIEATIEPLDTTWYPILDRELGEAEQLVVGWRQSGYLYFQSDILQEIVAAGNAFTTARSSLDGLFDQLVDGGDPALRTTITTQLGQLSTPITGLVTALDGYKARLATFETDLQKPHSEMDATIAQIQAEETTLQSQITTMNAQIASLTAQITTDREAIAKARSERTGGILETIFGIVLAPFTGGISLVLAGIGVATIAEAEGLIDGLEVSIAGYQTTIAGDQTTLDDDAKEITVLSGLTMCTQVALDDLTRMEIALDALRATWADLGDELTAVTTKLASSQGSEEAAAAKAWFDAACGEWEQIVALATSLEDQSTTTTRRTIG